MKMYKLLFTLLVVLFTNLSATNQSNAILINESSVKFVSDAPLERIEAVSKSLMGAIDTAKKVFSFKIKMSSFKGFNSALQKEHFEENYLEIMEFPYTTFTGKIIGTVDFSKDGDYEVRGKGSFTLHGIPNERIIKCSINVNKGKVIITSDFNVNLKDHNIAIPRLVKQKIADDIAVSLKINMK
mgnify:CR=1 FL=1